MVLTVREGRAVRVAGVNVELCGNGRLSAFSGKVLPEFSLSLTGILLGGSDEVWLLFDLERENVSNIEVFLNAFANWVEKGTGFFLSFFFAFSFFTFTKSTILVT